jgi:hypothetical protein
MLLVWAFASMIGHENVRIVEECFLLGRALTVTLHKRRHGRAGPAVRIAGWIQLLLSPGLQHGPLGGHRPVDAAATEWVLQGPLLCVTAKLGLSLARVQARLDRVLIGHSRRRGGA